MKCAIYARVSTQKQETDMQLTDLRKRSEREGWEFVEYIEKASSMKKRPVFDRMLEDARQRKIDIVLVWRIDRFARSMRQFAQVTLQLTSWGVRLVSHTENVDSGNQNPFAKFMLDLLALLAELERNIIVERVRAGVAEAKHKGKHCGRPKKVFRRDQALELRRRGLSWRAIARELSVPQATIRRSLAEKG